MSNPMYCMNSSISPRVIWPFSTRWPPTASTAMSPRLGSRSNAGRNALRTLADCSETRRMSSASTLRRAAVTASAPKPLTTRTPLTASSTTVASWACSACTASTAGWMRREKRVASTFNNGSGASAMSASSGCCTARMTTIVATIIRFEAVIGIITTKPWICSRSLEARLISCPVWVWSW